MMLCLFFLFFVTLILVAAGKRRIALIVALVNLILALGIFIQHITLTLDILL